jgi:hypothetical protein
MKLSLTAGYAVALLLVGAALALALLDDRDEQQAVEVVGEGCQDGPPAGQLRPYSLGDAFEGLALETVLLGCNGHRGGDTISYIYGDCEPPVGVEGGCAAPLQVQVWRACARTYRDYSPGNRSPLSRQRGVPVMKGERQIEVYADSTVVISAESHGLAERALVALRPMPRGGDPAHVPAEPKPRRDLPRPPPGALEKTLRCS